ncbi:hypothetical protein EI555_013789, partial [Monodon monoceros]
PAEATRKGHCTGGGSKTPPEVTGASPQPQAVYRQRKPVLAADNGVPAGVKSSVTSEEAGEGRGAAAELRGPQRSKRGARSPPSPAHVPGTWEAGTRLRTGRQEQPTHSQSPGRLPAFSLPALSCRGRSPSTSHPHTDLPGSQPAKQSSTGITRRVGRPTLSRDTASPRTAPRGRKEEGGGECVTGLGCQSLAPRGLSDREPGNGSTSRGLPPRAPALPRPLHPALTARPPAPPRSRANSGARLAANAAQSDARKTSAAREPRPWRGTPVPRPPRGSPPFSRPFGALEGVAEGGEVLENRFSLSRAPPNSAARWARGPGSRGLEGSGPPAPLPAPRAPVSSSTAPPPAEGRRGRLVLAQATLPSAGAAPSAQIPPRRLRTPTPASSTRRGGTATYLLFGVSWCSQSPRKVFANPKRFF